MNDKDYKKILSIIEYEPEDEQKFFYLLQQAFIRRSYSKEKGGQDNEILEFIGDKALDLAVIKKLIEYYGEINEDGELETEKGFNEGKLTNFKTRLVESSMLAHRIDIMGLNKYLIMGRGDVEKNVQNEQSVKEDLFEAIVGAVALDCSWDMDAIQDVVEKMLDIEYYVETDFKSDNNFVDLIQQWCQKKYNTIPKYDIYFNERTNDGFVCELSLPSFTEPFVGEGFSKSDARKNTAAEAYDYLLHNNLLYTLEDIIGEPSFDRAINQLQELAQKDFIAMPKYVFKESRDNDGNSVWRCECHVEDQEYYYHASSSSKKEAKKQCAYDMLKYIFEQEEK